MKKITKTSNGLKVQTINSKPSLTQQHFEPETNINNIMNRYEKTGLLPTSGAPVQYMDVSNIHDYHSSLNFIQSANKSFMSLPALVRKRFNNDPGLLLQFLNDPKNASEAYSLGLTTTNPNSQTTNPNSQTTYSEPNSILNQTIPNPNSTLKNS